MNFQGFVSGRTHLTTIPDQFFTDLLPSIAHIEDLKTLLFAFWILGQKEGAFRFVRREDFISNEKFMTGLVDDVSQAEQVLDHTLESCVVNGFLIDILIEENTGKKLTLYFLNSPKGRAAVKAIHDGKWMPTDIELPFRVVSAEFPNIFRLYEQNIGMLTPMIADMLREAEKTYPLDWIEASFRIAIKQNVRSWRYIEAILRRWKDKGRDDEKYRRDIEQSRRKYVEGEYADFIDH